MKLTIIVPCYDEEQVIGATHRRLLKLIDDADWDGEILYINDGSTDGTASMPVSYTHLTLPTKRIV